MGATSKRAKKVRAASEFNLLHLAAEMRAPKVSSGAYAWDLDAIRAARDAQMLGRFQLAARLAESTRTDYAIFASFLNRLAPQRGLPVKLEPPNDTARAMRVLDEATALFGPRGVGIHPDTLADIDGTLANHGVAFGVNVVTPRADGSRVDFELKTWPIEFVRQDPLSRSFKTQVEGYAEETICHGDGRWVVFQQHEYEPWKHGAILAIALLWADHAFGVRDRAKASTAHGNAKVVGTMPSGIALQSGAGGLSPEAAAFLELLRAIASADVPVGIKPFGSTLDYIVNNSTAWQIFKEIVDSGDKAADRVYLGHDVTASSSGGDAIGYLFGVRNDIVEGSLRAIERGIRTGVIEPWAAVNFGDSTLAPDRVYLMPDADEDARRKSLSERTTAFYAAIEAAKKNGFDVTQAYITALADDYGIIAPTLPAVSARAPSVTLAPTDVAKVVRVNEARASAGLSPLLLPNGAPDPDGFLTVEEFSARKAAGAQVLPPAAPLRPGTALRAVQPVAKLFDPSQPRADDGKFGTGPGSGGTGGDEDEHAQYRKMLETNINDERAAVQHHIKTAHAHAATAQGHIDQTIAHGRAFAEEARRTADLAEKEGFKSKPLRQAAAMIDKQTDKYEAKRPDLTMSKYGTGADVAKLEHAHNDLDAVYENFGPARDKIDGWRDVLPGHGINEAADRLGDEDNSPLGQAFTRFEVSHASAQESLMSARGEIDNTNDARERLLRSKRRLQKVDTAA